LENGNGLKKCVGKLVEKVWRRRALSNMSLVYALNARKNEELAIVGG